MGDGLQAQEREPSKKVRVLACFSCPRATLQVLHQACEAALGSGLVPGGSALVWATHYMEKVNSDQGCLNEWMAMSDLESLRPPIAEPGQSVLEGWGLGWYHSEGMASY